MADALTIAAVGMLAVFAFLFALVLSMTTLRVVAGKLRPSGDRGGPGGAGIDSPTLAAIIGAIYDANSRSAQRSEAQTDTGANS